MLEPIKNSIHQDINNEKVKNLDPCFWSKVKCIEEEHLARSKSSEDIITDVNDISTELKEQINHHLTYICSHLSTCLAELISQVPVGIEFFQTIKCFVHKDNISNLSNELSTFLSPTQVIAVSIIFSQDLSLKLDEKKLQSILSACDEAVKLYNLEKTVILPILTTHVREIAPNMCQLVGYNITAELLYAVGSLNNLSKLLLIIYK